jgi:hypothetical protein
MMDLSIATWGPPAGVVLLGAVVGLALSLRKTQSWDHDPRIADLRAEHELLMRQLRDLDADRRKLGEAVYGTHRAALVEKTGEVLRQLDQGVDGPPPKPKAASGKSQLPAYLAMVVVFLVAAGVALQQGVSERQENGSMTGNAGSAQGGGPGGVPQVIAAEAVLAKDPTDQAALCTVRKFALFTRDLESAMALMDRSRVDAPELPCTVTHLAALKVFIGRTDEASAALASMGSDAPNEARIWRAIIAMQAENTDGAKTLLRESIVNADDDLERDFASYLLSSLMMPPAQPQTSGAGAGGPQAGAGPAVTGTVQGSAEPGGVLYVYVRSSETERGPPLAALQLKEWQLPMAFDLSQAMVIRAVPEEFYVSAKLSRSGDPMVTGPDDLVAKAVGPVKAGDSIELSFE